MHVTIKTPEEQEKMRVAGRLAADVLDMIGRTSSRASPPRSSTGCCHEYIVNVQSTIPANLNYRGFPKTICTSVNHVVCHGIPNDKLLKAGDIVNIDVTVIKDGFHGDTSRMYYVGKPPVAGPAPGRDLLRGHVARHPAWCKPGAHLGDIGHAIQSFVESTASRWCASTAATASAASITRIRRCCTTASPAPGSSSSRHDVHRRADDQRRQAATCACCPTAGPW